MQNIDEKSSVRVPRRAGPTAFSGDFPHSMSVAEAQWKPSWERCRAQFRLQPDIRRAPVYVGADELRQRSRAMGSIFEMAITEMAHLHSLMPYEVGICLVDDEGVIVSFVSGGRFTDEARRAGMREGAIWSEAAQGTNGMGTCLAAKQPVLIRHDEHYLRQNSAFACCAAPLHDYRGRLRGALNISRRDELGCSPAVALVMQAAQTIEARALLVSSRSQHVLRFHPDPAFVTTAGEALLVIETDGRIAGANRNALGWLSAQSAGQVMGRTVEELLGMTLGQLSALASPHPRKIPGTGFHGMLQLPSATAGGANSESALAAAERRVLADTLDACGWNVSQAAKHLKLGRKTLHRRIRRYGLMRPRDPL